MATETSTKITYTMKLRNGVDDQGNVKTVNLNLGKLSLMGFNVQNAANLASLLTQVLDKSVTGEYIARTALVTS